MNKKDIRQRARKLLEENPMDILCGISSSRQMNNLSKMITGRYTLSGHKPLKVYIQTEPKADQPQAPAWTDGDRVYLIAGDPLLDGEDLEGRKDMLLGLLAHELGHVIWTDMKVTREVLEGIEESGKISSPLQSTKKIDEFVDGNAKIYASFLMQILNVIEDGFIETKMKERYAGKLKVCLNKLIIKMFSETETQFKEMGEESQLISFLLYFFRFGEVPDWANDFFNEKLKNSEEFLFDCYAVFPATRTVDRIVMAQNIIIEFWEFFEETLADTQAAEEFMKELADMLSQMSESEMEALEEALNQDGQQSGGIPIPAPSSLQSDEDSDEETDGNSGGGSGEISDEEADEEAGSSASDDENDDESSSTDDGKESESAEGEESGKPSNQRPVRRIEPTKGESELIDRSITEMLPEILAEETSRYLKDVENVEKIISTLNDDALVAISESNEYHKDASARIHIPEGDPEAYEFIYDGLKMVSKSLERKLLPLLQQREDVVQRGMYGGTRLDVRAIPRGDGKVFGRKRIAESADLAVGILLDESGSMHGDKIMQTRNMAIIMEDFCRKAGIPLTIIGHTEASCTVLFEYISFDKRNDKTRLASIQARNCNRDGYALRYVAEMLRDRPEEDKLLFIISDGQPNGNGGYCGETAYEDLREVKRDCARWGISLFAGAIDEDKDIIEQIYGDGYLNITNLSKLPDMLSRLIMKRL